MNLQGTGVCIRTLERERKLSDDPLKVNRGGYRIAQFLSVVDAAAAAVWKPFERQWR